MAFDGYLDPLIGNALFCEYESVFARGHVFERCPFDHGRRNMFLDTFLSICTFVDIRYLWRPNLPDEGDNHVMELAVAGQAERLITQNVRDFERAELIIPQVEIIHPFRFLEAWDKETERWQH